MRYQLQRVTAGTPKCLQFVLHPSPFIRILSRTGLEQCLPGSAKENCIDVPTARSCVPDQLAAVIRWWWCIVCPIVGQLCVYRLSMTLIIYLVTY
jgi:hypothetical protein